MTEYAIQLRGINKHFGPVKANSNVDLAVKTGSIHGIVGENGAGKSTLMSILYGFYRADSGSFQVFGKETDIRHSQDAIDAGIGMVHQHFMLVDTFTVIENIMLGSEGSVWLRHARRKAREKLNQLAESYGLAIDLDAIVGNLPVGLQQRVEILKALYKGAKILILDEPTGVLTPQESDELFVILRALREQGVAVLLITHKLGEIMDATEYVSVMRQGEMVSHLETANTNPAELAELMVGRKVLLSVDKHPSVPAEPVLKVQNLHVRDAQGIERVKGVSFDVCAGEIVGVAGVSGNGQSELLAALAGMLKPVSGSINIAGETISAATPSDPARLREAGVAHVPEDRHKLGMVTSFSAAESSVLGYQKDPTWNGAVLMRSGKVREHCDALMNGFDVRPPNPDLKSASFSGGNQQKLILAREMDRDPKVLLVGQPTRGVDIGAIELIYRRLIAMRDRGKAILLVSVELEEILSLSDRIIVMCDGVITGQMSAHEADERSIGLLMAAQQS